MDWTAVKDNSKFVGLCGVTEPEVDSCRLPAVLECRFFLHRGVYHACVRPVSRGPRSFHCCVRKCSHVGHVTFPPQLAQVIRQKRTVVGSGFIG